VIDDVLVSLAASPWALPLMFVLVVGDAFLVLIPGEVAVTAYGALAMSTGSPPLAAVIAVAAAGALIGDLACYAIGRRVGLDRWAWMRRPRVRAAFAWARERLDARMALVLFSARFIPFARLAVNLTAGAARLSLPRYTLVAGLAAAGWSAYQALIGALVAVLLPGGPVVAVIVSIVIAVVLGVVIDALLARRGRDTRRL
jgi:membrane-associated protein